MPEEKSALDKLYDILFFKKTNKTLQDSGGGVDKAAPSYSAEDWKAAKKRTDEYMAEKKRAEDAKKAAAPAVPVAPPRAPASGLQELSTPRPKKKAVTIGRIVQQKDED